MAKVGRLANLEETYVALLEAVEAIVLEEKFLEISVE